MSKSSTLRTIKLLFVFVVSVALVGADLVVLAQNSNSSTTTQDNMTGGNTNTGGGGARRRRGRRRRGGGAVMGDMSGNTNANLSPDMQNTNTGDATDQANMMSNSAGTGTGGGRRRRRGRRRSAAMGDMGANANMDTSANTSASGAGMTGRRYGRCDNRQQEQTDLSGTYSGTVDYAEGNLSGPATLTITGNSFTLDAGGQNIAGRVVATTTCGYTAAAMMLGQLAPSVPGQTPPAPPTTVSVRVRRTGGGINLMPVPGAMHQFRFTSGGGAGGGYGRRRRRGRRYGAAGDMGGSNMNTGAAADTGGNANMDTSGNANMDTNMNMGGGGRRRRRRGRRGGNMNMSGDNMNANMTGDMSGNMNGNMNTGDMTGDMSGNMNGNMNMRRPSRRRRGRRGTTNTNMGDNMNMGGNTNMGGNSNQ